MLSTEFQLNPYLFPAVIFLAGLSASPENERSNTPVPETRLAVVEPEDDGTSWRDRCEAELEPDTRAIVAEGARERRPR